MNDTADNIFITIVVYIVGFVGVAFCGGAAIVGCVLVASLYACGCLVCPQHENHDIPMEVMQDDLESAGNDSDLAESI